MTDSLIKTIEPSFEPINKAHAIVEAVLFCEFAPSLSENTLQKLSNLEQNEKLKSELPKYQPLIGFRFDFENPQIPKPQTYLGFKMSRIQPDGNIEWMLNLDEKAVSVHCLKYFRWDNFWKESKAYFDLILKTIGVSENKLVSVGLKYIDRFSFNGDLQEYDAKLLFNPSSQLIHPKAFDKDPRWHCHIGWFEENSQFDSFEFLNQLNIDSAYSLVQNHKKIIVTLEHTVSSRLKESSPADTELPQNDKPLFDEIFLYMHESNKQILNQLLEEQVKKKINLVKERSIK